jgi:hypothetical protein
MSVAADGSIEAAGYPAGLWRRRNAMRHFVRFARLSANGSVDRGGWRLRIFLTSDEAGAFAGDLAGRFWRVEIGDYEDGEAVPSGELARRLRAKAMRAEQRPGGR